MTSVRSAPSTGRGGLATRRPHARGWFSPAEVPRWCGVLLGLIEGGQLEHADPPAGVLDVERVDPAGPERVLQDVEGPTVRLQLDKEGRRCRVGLDHDWELAQHGFPWRPPPRGIVTFLEPN